MWPQLKYVNGYWDKEDYGGFFSCPQCGWSFTAKPFLKKNTVTSVKPLLYGNPVQMRMESVQWM